jgi:2-dehydropantoate 2-reductase
MRLVILGAGAIGGVIAGHLARAKREVIAIARGAHLAAIQANGLRVETPDGAFVAPLQAVAKLTEWRADDVLIVAVKTQDLAAALRETNAPPSVPIVTMTNGVEGERIALRYARVVYGGCIMMPATYLIPGTVQVYATPTPGLLDIGRYPDGTGDHADEIAGELNVAGFSSEVRTNIMRWKRGKLLLNLMNGAEAIAGPSARTGPRADQAIAEARAVYAAANLSCIGESEDAARRKALVYKPVNGQLRAGGSTWQSLQRGLSLETDYFNGEIVMLGRLHGVPTPINEALQLEAAAAR